MRLPHCFVPFGLAALLATAVATFPAGADDKKDEGHAAPPRGAVVLFDGKDLSGWTSHSGWTHHDLSKPAEWKLEDGYMEVVPGKGNIVSKKTFGDCQLHVEFWIPLMADKKSQARGNSGVYLQGRYEIQVLDSYKNDTYPKGECGALYSIIGVSKNACKPPEHWQTYDITFRMPRVDDKGKVTEKGVVTVVQNGETVIDKGQFDRPNGGELDRNQGTPGPLMLQDHGCKVRFRNIWFKPLKGGEGGA